VLSTGIALGLQLLTWPAMHEMPGILFAAAIMVSGFYGGWGPGLAAVALSSVALNSFFIAPLGQASPGPRALYAVVAVLITGLSVRARHAYTNTRLALRQAEIERARFQTLVQGGPSAINVFSGPNLVFQLASPATTLGLGGGELLGKSLVEIVEASPDTPHRRKQMVADLREVLRTGIGSSGSELAASRSGSGPEDTYWTWRYLPIQSPSGQTEAVMSIHTEVTELVLSRKRAEAIAAELKLADEHKDKFLAMLSHELCTPIQSISLGLSMLERARDDQQSAKQHLPMVKAQLKNLVRLVDDLLDVTRISSGKIDLQHEEVDLASVLEQAVAAKRPMVEARQHTLDVTVGNGPFKLRGDATRLEQVITNLLSNAARYTQPGGRIHVELSRHEDRAVLKVSDTGRGISPDMLEKIFELFFQVDRSMERAAGGLGVGLHLVKHLVELHGGTVVAISEGVGKGTQVVLQLPLVERAPLRAGAAA
jgi:signal transduction histidine kinase